MFNEDFRVKLGLKKTFENLFLRNSEMFKLNGPFLNKIF